MAFERGGGGSLSCQTSMDSGFRFRGLSRRSILFSRLVRQGHLIYFWTYWDYGGIVQNYNITICKLNEKTNKETLFRKTTNTVEATLAVNLAYLFSSPKHLRIFVSWNAIKWVSICICFASKYILIPRLNCIPKEMLLK